MHFVFIVGSYYPHYSAVGKCVGNVADVLSQRHKVTVICEKNYSNQLDKEIHNNQIILRIITQDKIKREKIIQNIQSAQGLKKKFHSLQLNILKLQQASKITLSKSSIKKGLVDSYLSKLLDINEKIDVIIPTSMPFESVVAAHKYKKAYDMGIILIPYLFDKFTDSQTLHRLKINRLIKRQTHIQLEESALSSADKVMAMHSLKKFYENEMPHLKHFVYIEHPLIIPHETIKASSLTEIKLAYIGGFYKKYVEPNYLLKLYSQSSINARLDFYVIGNCDNLLNKYSKKGSLRIMNHGSVDKRIANGKIAESDILISVAEKRGLQLSSKIFDYVSFGKPIVHFYNSDEDITRKVLDRYPLALCIKEEIAMLSQNVSLFEKFCIENSTKNVSTGKIIELFPDALPQYTSSLIESVVEEKIKK